MIGPRADMVWHNAATNETQFWLMSGNRTLGRYGRERAWRADLRRVTVEHRRCRRLQRRWEIGSGLAQRHIGRDPDSVPQRRSDRASCYHHGRGRGRAGPCWPAFSYRAARSAKCYGWTWGLIAKRQVCSGSGLCATRLNTSKIRRRFASLAVNLIVIDAILFLVKPLCRSLGFRLLASARAVVQHCPCERTREKYGTDDDQDTLQTRQIH